MMLGNITLLDLEKPLTYYFVILAVLIAVIACLTMIVRSPFGHALAAARAQLNPAAGVMLAALWVADTRHLAVIVHHLAVDAVSWRILLEDLNIAWMQHRAGQPVALPPAGTSFRRWAELLAEHAQDVDVVDQVATWQRVAQAPALLPAVQPAVDTFAAAGHLTAELDAETSTALLGAVPAAFHAGINDILVIGFALAAVRARVTPAPRPHATEGDRQLTIPD